jgi:hypothetical protein
MATYEQLPGTLNLKLRAGDELGTVITFSGTTLTGYTVASSVVSLVTGDTVAAMTTVVYGATAGQVQIAMSETATSAIAPGTYGWNLVWDAPGSVRRTALTGTFEVRS